MTKMAHEEARELLGAYALGAMPEDELKRVRSHVMSCEECMREADSLSDTVASFGISAGNAPLPADFSDGILETVREQRPIVAPRTAPRRSWLAVAAGVAGLTLTVGALFGMMAARSQVERQEKVLQAMLREDGFSLSGTSGAVAKVIPVGDGSVLAATGLRAAPDGHDYQLWLIEDGEPRSAGVFDVEDGIAIVETDLALKDYDTAAVTIEPDGGLDKPSGDPVLVSG
ncbi:MAG TPA: anti-sigma factor [Actinomycetota bacterium]|nr:anti-sigma factor [Actinomycetota bacterium]